MKKTFLAFILTISSMIVCIFSLISCTGGSSSEINANESHHNASSNVSVADVSINPSSIALEAGDTIMLSVSFYPSDATDKSVTWSSSNTSVASVMDGLVMANSSGVATITVKTSNNKTATCEIIVENPRVLVSSVSLNETSATLQVGDTLNLYETIYPSDATDKSVTWSSSNTSVASVMDGLVTANSSGVATITVKTSNNKTATCEIIVNNIEIQSISFEKEEYIYDCLNETLILVPIIYPSNADTSALTWSSDNESVYPDENGKIVALSSGTALITVTTNNGRTASCIVKAEYCYYSLKFTKSQYEVTVGNIANIQYYKSPSYGNCKIEGIFSDEEVATIIDGRVVGLKEGTTTLTIKTHKGISDSCTIICKKGVAVETPSCPTTIENWSNPAYFQTQTAQLTSITYSIEEQSTGIYINLSVKGTKTWCRYSGSYVFKINYKLVDENNVVVVSGTLTSNSCDVNEGFVITKRIWISNSELDAYGQNFKLILSDVAW